MGSGFTNVYLKEVRKISEDVNNRSYNQLKLTKSAQLFDLLVQTSNEITEKRFIPHHLLGPIITAQCQLRSTI